MACHAFKFWDNQRACLAMVFMQLLYAGMALLSKAALNKGMSYFVFVVYRQAIATLALTPFVCIYERRKAPPMSLIVFCKIFLLALLGLTLSMDLYYMALRYTSATFATTIINIIPAMTFLIAILLRIESINLRRTYGRLKIVGMLICIGGAVLLSLYQGPPLKLLNWHHNIAPPRGRGVLISHGEDKPMTLKGPLLMFAAFTAWSIWFVMQAEILKDYPAKMQLTALQCFLSTIQSAITALILDRNIDSWKLGNFCEWSFLLVADMVYRDERSGLCGHVFTTVCAHNCYTFSSFVGRTDLLWKCGGWITDCWRALLRFMGKEQGSGKWEP
ncbi:WAT1-related protein At1g43650-like isoform X2 [Magnolia sinica]|uniref:WAT1-related protein At1g43650-like isoform X2 n=1 Tax=Magnolia sinica TaxID=86752 RepID=UPI002658BE83|nr:WAT1-related protein At1g43650-like isoform X2 [Magnolia sinica]